MKWSVTLQWSDELCRFCAGRTWDRFYLVMSTESGRLKFGITSHDFRRRLNDHRLVGYRTVVRLLELDDANELERAIMATLALADIHPAQGREFFDASALPVVLDVVDNWPLRTAVPATT